MNFNVPPTSKQNPPDAERVSSYLTAIRGILLAAINLRVVKIRLPQSLFYGIFPVSSYCLDSENQKVDPYMMELNNQSDIRQAQKRARQDSRTWNRARTTWINTKGVLLLVQDILQDQGQFDVQIDFGMRLVYPPIIRPLPTGELSERCHELIDLYRKILSNASTITKLSIELDQGSAIRDFYDIFDPRLNFRARNLTTKLGAIQQQLRIPTMTPPLCPDFWRCLQLSLNSLILILSPVSPVDPPTSFPTTLRDLRLGISTRSPRRPGFETLVIVLSTLPHLERFHFWEEKENPSTTPFTATIIATKLKYLAIHTIHAIPNVFWRSIGVSCSLLKVIQFPRNKYLSSNDITAVSHLHLDSASFVTPPDQWQSSWDRINPEIIITACKEFRHGTRVDMDCLAFSSITRTKTQLSSLAKQAWARDEIWVKSERLLHRGGKDFDLLSLDWEIRRVNGWYPDVVTVEKYDYFPNLWSENTGEYYCGRISLDKIREESKNNSAICE